MKYNEQELKHTLLIAFYEAGYYTALWSEEGGKDAREEMGYYNGMRDAFYEMYGVEEFNKTQEAKTAYQNGVNQYYKDKHEQEEEEREDEEDE